MSGEPLANGRQEIYTLNVGQADEVKVVDELETVLADRPVDRTEDGTISFTFAATLFHTDHIKGFENLGFNDYVVSHVIQPDESRIKF